MNFNSPVLAAMLRNSRHNLQQPASGRPANARPLHNPNKTDLAGGGRFARWHVADTLEREPESWLLTYLDLITLLLALLVVLLAVSRVNLHHGRQPSPAPEAVALVGTLRMAAPVDEAAAPVNGSTSAAHWLDLSFPPLETPTPAVLSGAALADITPPADSDAKPAPDAAAVQLAATPVSDTPPLTPPSIDELGLDELRDSVDVVVNNQSISFRISNELLFPSGQANLHAAGLAVLKRLAAVLNRSDYPVSVEGHSDNVPIQTRYFPSNWDLSTSRATSVLRGLQRAGVSSSRLRAVGYADTRPIVANDTPQGRAANRRVELIMEITPPAKTAPTVIPPQEGAVEAALP